MSTTQFPPISVFGIRHHGPGSARSVRRALEQLQPDVVLVEGPPDADNVLPLLAHAAMQPPVALLVYVHDEPRRSVYYPFAVFSPEWQAVNYALASDVAVRFMDLPHQHQLALRQPTVAEVEPQPEPDDGQANADDAAPAEDETFAPHHDPLGYLARAAGYSEGERWWEQMVEQRVDDADIFAAILEAMHALRAESPPSPDPVEAQREAWMRQTIRAAQKAGNERIAVVCGAWHAPVLVDLGDAKADAALLKGLPKVKTQATWTPWTYSRLSYTSGYGAGIESPGWYAHLWQARAANLGPSDVTTHWMTRVARLLRGEDLDASSAHVIEAVRLAETLAALRERPLPGLAEMNEASQTVFCFGSDTPMRLIHERLIIGSVLGSVPDETPMVPLQQDFQREQKRLRLRPEADWRDLDLDLRKPNDLDRSYLLRRLGLLGIPWGQLQGSSGTGTFRETWRLEWTPEFAVALIEASIWGNTVLDAASARARDAARHADALPMLVAVINQALLANMPAVVGPLMAQLQEQAALTSDVLQLMDALVAEDRATRSSLIASLRYGTVRKTDTDLIQHVVDGLVVRTCIGLPPACASLDDDAAAAMFGRIVAVDAALRLLQNDEHVHAWHAALRRVADNERVHGLVAGRCCRILLDAGVFDAEETARRVSLALSAATGPEQAAAWVEGLLRGSGLVLLHDDSLWTILDQWVAMLNDEVFVQVLPLLRRTFATFAAPERRQMGERARRGQATGQSAHVDSYIEFDTKRAEAVLPLVAQLLGVAPDLLNHEEHKEHEEV